MGAMVSPDSLAVAIQLSAKLRRPCLYSDHVVGGIGVGPQRLRTLRHPVSSDSHAALGARSQRDGRGDDYGGHRHLIKWIPNTFFVLYYPALAMFAVVFTSFRLSFAWVTLVAVVYAALSLVMEPGVDYEIKEEKVLFTRIAVMYTVVAAVNLVSRFERIRRRVAVEREGELQRERIELSQTIHDTIAQSAYMMGLALRPR